MIVILGAGIIGLSLGYQLLKKGKKIKIFDTNSVKGRSSQASVGMLAPLIEAKPQEKELFNLQCWALTAEAFFSKDEWEWLFQKFSFTGDYEFIYF